MVTINQLAEMAMKIAGKNMSIHHIPGPLGVRGRNSDNKLIETKLNWKPSQPLQQGLKITYEWIQKQHPNLGKIRECEEMKNSFTISWFVVLHKSLLFISDTFTLCATYFMAHTMWLQSSLRHNQEPNQITWLQLMVFVGVLLLVLIMRGTYRFHHSVVHSVLLKELIKALIIGLSLIILISFFTKAILFGRLQAFFTFIMIIPLMIITRRLVEYLWGKYIAHGIKKKNVLVYGAGYVGKRLVKSVRQMPKLNYKVVGFLDDNIFPGVIVTSNPLKVLGGLQDMCKLVKELSIDKIWIALPKADTNSIIQIIDRCKECGMPFRFVPGLSEIALHHVKVEFLDGIPLFGLKKLQISSYKRFIKRMFDILFSIVILTVLSPIMGLIAVMIKRDSKGPVIFKQKRVGYHGREFMFYKFRSMNVETEKYAVNPTHGDDPRVTKMGKFLRRTSLDELLQFWNVLIGNMSVVGPRPEMPFIVEGYNDIHRERLNVKPGITGLWQISGDRALPIHENIDHDLYYIENQSFLLDLVIIFETIIFAIKGIGAH